MKKKELTYDQAYKELNEILTALQQEDAGLDDLSSKLARATELTQFCKQKLREIDSEVSKLTDINS
jgi:exodeoxyribonuclease VII small subunit